jgi:hypothetical protein
MDSYTCFCVGLDSYWADTQDFRDRTALKASDVYPLLKDRMMKVFIPRDKDGKVVVRTDILIFRLMYDSRKKNDVSTAFHPHACLFALANRNVLANNIFAIENGPPKKNRADRIGEKDNTSPQWCLEKADAVLGILKWYNAASAPQRKLRAVAFFSHGFTGSNQFRFSIKNGGNSSRHVSQLAAAIAQKSYPDVRVVLYECYCGESEEERIAFDDDNTEEGRLACQNACRKILRKQNREAQKQHKLDTQEYARKMSLWKRAGSPAGEEPKKPVFEHPYLPRPEKDWGRHSLAFVLRDELVDAFNAKGEKFVGWVDAHATLGHAVQNPNVRRFPAKKGEDAEFIVVPAPPWRRRVRVLVGNQLRWKSRPAGTSVSKPAPRSSQPSAPASPSSQPSGPGAPSSQPSVPATGPQMTEEELWRRWTWCLRRYEKGTGKWVLKKDKQGEDVWVQGDKDIGPGSILAWRYPLLERDKIRTLLGKLRLKDKYAEAEEQSERTIYDSEGIKAKAAGSASSGTTGATKHP